VRGKQPRPLTPLELDVMDALWTAGSGTVQIVRERLRRRRPLAYNTVQTILTILHRKRRVKRRLVGKAFVYEPKASRQQTAAAMIRGLIDRVFGGSPTALVMAMLEDEQIRPDDLGRIRRLIRQHEHDAR
jgi:BlaI family transcriptional regulator, penicillinase repressor